MPERWLLERYRRDTQPVDGSQLAFNPNLPRPVFCAVGSLPRYDLASGKLATHTASDSYGSSRLGSAFRCARVANAGLTFPASVRPISGDSWTIIALANPVAGNIQALFSQRTNAAPYSQIDLAVNIGNGFAARSGGFVAITVDNSGAANYPAAQSQSTSLVNGAMHVYGATRASAATHPVLYYDGAAIPITTGGTPASSVQAGQLTRVGNLADYTGSDWAASCDFPLVLVYDRPLSAAQMRLLGQLPWMAFADEERQIRIFTGSAQHNLTGSNSSQSAASGTGAASQTHALTGAGASQSAQAISLAISQEHALQGSPSVSTGTSGTGAIGQSVTLTGLDASQANQSSEASISQVAQLSGEDAAQSADSSTGAISVQIVLAAAHSQQANQSSAAGVTQTHALVGAASYQVNTGSVASISGDIALGASTSIQSASSTTAAITQNQTLFGVGSSQSSAAHSAAISQIQALFGSVSVQPNQSLADALTQIHILSGLNSTQNALSSASFITIPGAGEFKNYIKNRLFVIGKADRTFIIKRGGTKFTIER